MRDFKLYVQDLPLDVDDEALEDLAARETSDAMWRVLTAGTTYEKLAAALEEEYAGNLDRAAADVDLFLATLHERGVPGH